MPLMFRYYFGLGTDVKCIYATSEVVARAIFKLAFDKEAGTLIKRKPW